MKGEAVIRLLNRIGLVAAIAAALCATSQAYAQVGEPTPFGAAARRVAVSKAADALRRQYVYPDIGAKAAQTIEDRLAVGEYDQLNDPAAYGKRLTDDLQGVTHDKHLRIFSLDAPPAPAAELVGLHSEAGVVRADRLPGDIGYLEVVGFPNLQSFQGPIDRAMATLSDTKALIIDLRRNGGGEPKSVAYLVSYFLDTGTPVHINDLIYRDAGTDTYRTESYFSVPTSAKYLHRQIYLLTSHHTFSGGEEFAYDIQSLKLGKLIGEITGGGANPGDNIRLGDRFIMFIPKGRALNPITKTNWEGEGVQPDVTTSDDEALSVAFGELGQRTTVRNIDALSQARLFKPRAIPLPNSEPALRALVAGFVSKSPRYDLMQKNVADFARQDAPNLEAKFTPLGALKSVAFLEVDGAGGDVYDLTFEKGVLRWAVLVDSQGLVTGFSLPLTP